MALKSVGYLYDNNTCILHETNELQAGNDVTVSVYLRQFDPPYSVSGDQAFPNCG